MIAISLSPNTERDDVLLALKMLFQPWKWQRGDAREKLKTWFQQKFKTSHVFLYNSGRSALFEILKAYGIGNGDEVILQAFTCIAVPNSVRWTGAIPIYIDIDKSYNLSPWQLEKHITKRTKAIIVQHTFGIPAEIDKIVTIAQKHHIIVIEDCAHALGASYKGKLLGTWGTAAFFSFGRDKVLSSVFGGVGIIRNDKSVTDNMTASLTGIRPSRGLWILQQLIHPIAFAIILPLYQLQLGKVFLVALQKLHLLSFPVYPEEKQGKQPDDFPRQYPNALAVLALHQVGKLDRFNEGRRQIAEMYYVALQKNKSFILPPKRNGAIFLRYPILHENSKQIFLKAKQHGLLIGNWYHNVIDPAGCSYDAVNFAAQQYPEAKQAANTIINLPTRITQNQAQQLISVLQ